MIPYNTITAWGASHPWATREQIEQDMLLSKAICDIYNNEKLANELIFRGGTALNKVILNEPYRYSEDLDFVRTSIGGIGDIMKELTCIGKETGYEVKTKIGQYPKLYWLTQSQTGHKIRFNGAHLHMHLCPRYLDDDFPGMAIDLSCPSDQPPYESYKEYLWFIDQMTKELSDK